MFPFDKSRCHLARTALVFAICSASAYAVERHAILFQGERLQVVDRGGLAIWQGDIVLGRTADLLEATRLADLLGAATLPPGKGTGLGTATGRWARGSSGLFEVPYIIENDPDAGVPPAIVAFNQQLAGFVRAVPRGAEADYVAFNFDAADTTGPCFSSIGRVGGRQLVGGARNCSVGRLVHELGHALGLFHEQERSDAGRWVTIDLAGVDPSLAYNYVPSVNTRDLGSYDYGSIMHYGSSGFSKTGSITMESIPPGIAFGQRDGYSRGDLDSLHRLYGLFEASIVVDSFPSGLTVMVDGVNTVTPATFNWPLGSTHALDVPAGAQTLAGTVHAFARWSSDSDGTLASRQNVVIAPGEGTLTQPGNVPAISVYTANFVRMKAVRFSTSGNRTGIGGTLSIDPQPVSLAGASGTYYRERQPFTLTPAANAGATFGRWRGTYSFPIATSTNYTPLMRGPLAFSETLAAYDFTAYFVDFPFTTVKARAQDGDVLGISATLARANGGSASQRLPYNTTDTTTPWAAGEAGTITFPARAVPFAGSVRYAFVSANGSTLPGAVLAHPASGQPSQTLVATYNKQYQPYSQVIPNCAGAITLGTDADGWIDAGAAMPVSLATNAGWTLAEWRGSLSGTGSNRSLTATDVPDVTAVLNLVAAPLAVTAVSPPSTPAGRPLTLEIIGQGFATASRVLVAGVSRTPSSITATRIVVPLAASDYPATGKVVVTVQNRVGGTGSCALNASAVFETFVADTALDPALDTDGDGIPNGAEATVGTNPRVKDNDVFADTLLGRQLFVMQQFRDFLGREGDAAGIGYWSGEIAAGRQTRASMAESFLNSAEYQNRVAPIIRLYFATYLRVPDIAGLDYWVGQYQGGLSLANIAEAFARAPEFVARYGTLSNRDYVTRLYQNILERTADVAGSNFWTARLDSGATSRGAMLSEFSESAEYKAKSGAGVYVTAMYSAFLRRAPDAAGFDYWRQQIASGVSGQVLVSAFLGAAEYSKRFLR